MLPSVVDAGPTLARYWVNVSCLLCISLWLPEVASDINVETPPTPTPADRHLYLAGRPPLDYQALYMCGDPAVTDTSTTVPSLSRQYRCEDRLSPHSQGVVTGHTCAS